MRKLEEWIGYMEEFLDFRQMGKLSMLLRHSIADQVIVDNLRRLRRLIRGNDPARKIEPLLNDPIFMEQLHSRIMRGVEQSRRENRTNADPTSAVFLGQRSSQETYSKR